MAKVTVDTEKLAYGLERGIGDTRTIFASLATEDRLRMTACGLVSSAITAYALNEGIACRQVISVPGVPIDPTMQHVIPLLGDTEGNNPVAIEASASLFLGYAGMMLGYEWATGEHIFPPEKIFVFSIDEKRAVVEWLTSAAIKFQKINKQPTGRFGLELGDGPLVNSPASEIWANYDLIYDFSNYHTHRMIERVREDGEIVSKRIPKNSIMMG